MRRTRKLWKRRRHEAGIIDCCDIDGFDGGDGASGEQVTCDSGNATDDGAWGSGRVDGAGRGTCSGDYVATDGDFRIIERTMKMDTFTIIGKWYSPAPPESRKAVHENNPHKLLVQTFPGYCATSAEVSKIGGTRREFERHVRRLCYFEFADPDDGIPATEVEFDWDLVDGIEEGVDALPEEIQWEELPFRTVTDGIARIGYDGEHWWYEDFEPHGPYKTREIAVANIPAG